MKRKGLIKVGDLTAPQYNRPYKRKDKTRYLAAAVVMLTVAKLHLIFSMVRCIDQKDARLDAWIGAGICTRHETRSSALLRFRKHCANTMKLYLESRFNYWTVYDFSALLPMNT
jgi:hypothetical protein